MSISPSQSINQSSANFYTNFLGFLLNRPRLCAFAPLIWSCNHNRTKIMNCNLYNKQSIHGWLELKKYSICRTQRTQSLSIVHTVCTSCCKHTHKCYVNIIVVMRLVFYTRSKLSNKYYQNPIGTLSYNISGLLWKTNKRIVNTSAHVRVIAERVNFSQNIFLLLGIRKQF